MLFSDASQTTDDINESSFDLPLVIGGTPLLEADGSVYKDAKGNEVSVWNFVVIISDPSD